LPLIGLSVCAKTGNIYAGLYYPMIIAAITFVIGSLMLKQTHGKKIRNEVGGVRQTNHTSIAQLTLALPQ
jgi:hypothetical protein